MGCDIHLFVEKRIPMVKWVSVDKWVPDKESKDKAALMVPYNSHYYSGRNYNLFAILADVRNGRGFAGIDTGDGFNPISDPKGLPLDVSPEVQLEFDRWGADGHTPSFHRVKDLLEYDWTQVTKLRGVVNAVEFYRWNRWSRGQGEGPKDYCGSVSGASILFLSVNETERQIQDLEKQYPGKSTREMEKIIGEKMMHCYCKVEWEQPYYKTCRYFWSDTIPRLLRLGKPENVRIIFWFDN